MKVIAVYDNSIDDDVWFIITDSDYARVCDTTNHNEVINYLKSKYSPAATPIVVSLLEDERTFLSELV